MTVTGHAGALSCDALPIASPDAFAPLRDDWERLFVSAPHEPSTSFEWTSAMLRHHVRGDDRVVVLRWSQDNRPVAMMPLVARRFSVLRQRIIVLTPLSDEYNTHSDWLITHRTPAVADAVVDGLLALDMPWDCFRLSRLLEDNPLTGLLTDALARRRVPYAVRRTVASYFLELPATYEEYLSARSSKFRNFLRRAERKLATAGRTAVQTVSDPADLDDAYDRLLEIERASWKHAHGTAVTAVPRQMGFYRDLCREALRMGRLHLQWLTLDDRPVAYNLGYISEGGYAYLKTSFDQAHKDWHPATILRARLIEAIIDRGIRRFDFPGEPYEWERQWTDTVRWHSALTMYSSTLRGRALAIAERVRHARTAEREVEHLDPRAQKAPRAG